jgi:hypothetical protein
MQQEGEEEGEAPNCGEMETLQISKGRGRQIGIARQGPTAAAKKCGDGGTRVIASAIASTGIRGMDIPIYCVIFDIPLHAICNNEIISAVVGWSSW